MLCYEVVQHGVAVQLELLAVLQYIACARLLADYYVLILTHFKQILLVFATKWFIGAARHAVVLFMQSAHKV